jgi:hypothetical protein
VIEIQPEKPVVENVVELPAEAIFDIANQIPIEENKLNDTNNPIQEPRSQEDIIAITPVPIAMSERPDNEMIIFADATSLRVGLLVFI